MMHVQHAGTFYLFEDLPLFIKYMSEPVKLTPGTSALNTPGYFVAGIVKGYLHSAGFEAEYASAKIGPLLPHFHASCVSLLTTGSLVLNATVSTHHQSFTKKADPSMLGFPCMSKTIELTPGTFALSTLGYFVSGIV